MGNLPGRRPDQLFRRAKAAISAGGAAGILRARQVIIVGPAGELLVYSPTAAAGNLIASISAVATTDPYGNAVNEGVWSYDAPGVGLAAGFEQGEMFLASGPVSGAGPWTNQFAALVQGTQVQLNALQNGDTLQLFSGPPGGGGAAGGAGTTIDNLMAGGGAAFKNADTSQTTNTVLTPDPDLQLSNLVPNAVYEVVLLLRHMAGGANPGIQWQFATNSGAMNFGYRLAFTNISGTLTQADDAWTANQQATAAATQLRGTLKLTSGTTLVFSWAQVTSSATATTVGQGSHLIARRIA